MPTRDNGRRRETQGAKGEHDEGSAPTGQLGAQRALQKRRTPRRAESTHSAERAAANLASLHADRALAREAGVERVPAAAVELRPDARLRRRASLLLLRDGGERRRFRGGQRSRKYVRGSESNCEQDSRTM